MFFSLLFQSFGQFDRLDKFGGIRHRKASVDSDIAYTSTSQSGKMSSRAKCLTDVAGKRPDIGPFAAHHADGDAFGCELEEFDFVDYENLRFELDVLAFAGKVIGTLAVDLTC